jgi:hypothetical protein
MAIIPKTKTVQFRVETELFDNFAREVELCDGVSVSSVLRSAMKLFISDRQRRRKTEISNAEWAATLQSRREATSVSTVPEKPPVGASGKLEGPVARRMRLKKEAKARRKGDDSGDDDVEYDDE